MSKKRIPETISAFDFMEKFPTEVSAREYLESLRWKSGVVWAVIKRGYHGACHHWSVKHLGRHISEFSFRLNEGSYKRDTSDRISDLCIGSLGRRLTCERLVR